MNLNAKPNQYQQACPNCDDTPKAVIAALAYSLAMRLCCDDEAAAQSLLAAEWRDLHAAGIVPQKPR